MRSGEASTHKANQSIKVGSIDLDGSVNIADRDSTDGFTDAVKNEITKSSAKK